MKVMRDAITGAAAMVLPSAALNQEGARPGAPGGVPVATGPEPD